MSVLIVSIYFVQVFGETSVEVIERDVSRLAGGFVGLAIGAAVTYFIAVSEELCTFSGGSSNT